MTVSVGIIGASGYTGAEAVRLLLVHPEVRITALTGDRHAGKPLTDLYAGFYGYDLPNLVRVADLDLASLDVVFCCLPHGASHQIIAELYAAAPQLRIIDLSADFRLNSAEQYAEWYQGDHSAPALLQEAACGLTELNRDTIRQSRLVACPGCFPTGSTLALAPLLAAGLIDTNDIIIDAKTGVSGAGRALKEGMLYCESAEGLQAYSVASHRHIPETEQYLRNAVEGDAEIKISFTPHLAPMLRGIAYTIYVRLSDAVGVSGRRPTAQDIRACWREAYEGEAFMRLLPEGQPPQTRHVQGSNFVDLNAIDDRIEGRAILLASLDNLTKGSSGQAIQNMNLMLGFEETAGLMAPPRFP